MFDILPKHVALIMDGNRRWAKREGFTPFEGHKKGLERSKEIVEECMHLGVSCVTLWGFSTENWSRDRKEVDYLMKLFERYLDETIDSLYEKGMKVRHIGRKDRIPAILLKKLTLAEEKTTENTGLTLQLAIDYGGRDEIYRAVCSAIEKKMPCSEEEFGVLLDTADSPDPDLIIRTSGEMRLSGFLAWQGVYSELYFTDKCFPEFRVEEFHKALEEYARRNRTHGG